MSEKPQPFEELDELIERMNRQFGELSRTFEGGSVLSEIAVDVADTGDDIVVTADLPGFAEEDIDLRADRESVTLSADSESETVDEDANYHRKERTQQSVSRRVPLPQEVDAESATANYANGVLTVTLPKLDPDAAGGHEIDVE
ncbi:Hsp20/alpha crystallin family protein [Halonotius terrestris]|uniref:Hsp20/alpha crystallin family protein n=1 Tax=Halonotius terrestris TaxID=2487750 RepID=A0A8J8PFK3_9EURY|nr:Hsp20/alpha crystallin family protein [Halonotius terrestris]TQQ83732.1 Hsp20/alpha crystallin family protein [Halonotius terrestris]